MNAVSDFTSRFADQFPSYCHNSVVGHIGVTKNRKSMEVFIEDRQTIMADSDFFQTRQEGLKGATMNYTNDPYKNNYIALIAS